MDGEILKLNGLYVNDYINISSDNHAKFDLTFIFSEKQDVLNLYFVYNNDVYSENQINFILDNLWNLFPLLGNHLLTDISNLNFITEKETLRLLDYNLFEGLNLDSSTIIDYFEKSVKENPSNLALVFDGNEYTYVQLNSLSNQFSHFLLSNYKLNSEEIIGLLLPRNEWMIIGVLGIMKAGCCYLPLDINYPKQRVDFIIKDSNCKVIIDQDAIELFRIERFRYNKENLINKSKINHLAYCIYTSGSTGQPKGVLVEHRHIANTIKAQIDLFRISNGDCTGLFASFNFDASISEIFTTLISGARLYVFKKEEIEDIQIFGSIVQQKSISILTITPAYLKNVNVDSLCNLKTLISAGESANKDVLEKIRSRGVNVLNAYGPTEASICATTFELNEVESENLPIGKPIDGVYIQLMTEDLQLVPYGSIGEICIGGV